MRKRIKLKAHVKPKCDCENHYLELCTVFDGFENTYFRKCTKCGKSWTEVEKTYELIEHTVETATDITGRTITLYKPVIRMAAENNGQFCVGEIVADLSVANTLYYVNKDGTLSMLYNGGD